jgi:hypothetical protein
MPLRASFPVSKALRKTHSYLKLRHNHSIKAFSIPRPRPSMEMREDCTIKARDQTPRSKIALDEMANLGVQPSNLGLPADRAVG